MSLIQSINAAIKTNKNRPITIQASAIIIYDVFGARKYPGGQTSSIEPHTDIILDKRAGKKTNISLKQEPLSSLSKGNIRGLEAIIPGITKRFMNTAFSKLQQMSLEEEQQVPEIYGHLKESDKEKIFVGKTSTGGPIDYIYIGSQNTQYDEDTAILTLAGEFIDPISYVEKKEFYLKLTPLYGDQGFNSKTVIGGVHSIYGKSKINGINENRIILTEQVDNSEVVVEID
jgi:hypothetical protein